MTWFKIDFNDVFFNGLTTLEIGCVVKYKCLCQQMEVEELNEKQLKLNFSWKERQFLIKHFLLSGQFEDNSRTVLGQSEDKVGTILGQSEDKPSNFLSSKNNDLTIYNNINNINTRQEEKRKEKKKYKKRNFEEEFATWWKECPRKVSKLDAEKSFYRLLESGSVTFEELLSGMKRYAEYCRDKDEQFIKHPSTWLNQGCWVDEYKDKQKAENFSWL